MNAPALAVAVIVSDVALLTDSATLFNVTVEVISKLAPVMTTVNAWPATALAGVTMAIVGGAASDRAKASVANSNVASAPVSSAGAMMAHLRFTILPLSLKN